jgi:hypothetical protein
MAEVFRVPISKDQLCAIPADDRNLLLLTSHAVNQISILRKLLILSLNRSTAFTYPARDLMWCNNTPAIGGQANVPTSRPAPSLLKLSTVCRQPPTTRSFLVLTEMSAELDRAVTQGDRASIVATR